VTAAIAPPSPASALLSDASVNALAQQVGVTVVAGVLLDHVDQQLPEGDWLVCSVTSDEAQVCLTGELLGEGDLVTPGVPGCIDNGLIGRGTVEVAVGLGFGLETRGHVLTSEPLPEPLALDISQVSQQTQERHRGRLNRTAGKLLGVETFALELQRKTLTAQKLDQRLALVPKRWASLTRINFCINEHVGMVLWLCHGLNGCRRT
jgi:hypothetical protein